MTLDEFRESVRMADAPPAGSSTLLQALWHDARGDWARAHGLAQEVETKAGAWVHAYLHRKEPDSNNARYWYRRAALDEFQGSFEEEWEAIVEALLEA
jgi:hypothetical protein